MRFPRVTEILKPYTGYDKVPPQILNNAAARGNTVHALCAGIAKGEWIPETMIQPDHLGYVNSFKKWSDSQVKEFVQIEKRYQSESYEFTGQIDYVMLGTDEELYLADLKTCSSHNKTHPLQIAAYEHMLRRHDVDVKGSMLVYLDKNGEFPDIELYDDLSEQFQVFLAANQCWHYFNRGKK